MFMDYYLLLFKFNSWQLMRLILFKLIVNCVVKLQRPDFGRICLIQAFFFHSFIRLDKKKKLKYILVNFSLSFFGLNSFYDIGS